MVAIAPSHVLWSNKSLWPHNHRVSRGLVVCVWSTSLEPEAGGSLPGSQSSGCVLGATRLTRYSPFDKELTEISRWHLPYQWRLLEYFLNKNIWILKKLLLDIIKCDPIADNEVLNKVMAWCWISYEPLSEPMMTQFCDFYPHPH